MDKQVQIFVWFIALVKPSEIFSPDGTTPMSDILFQLKAWRVAEIYNMRRRLYVVDSF